MKSRGGSVRVGVLVCFAACSQGICSDPQWVGEYIDGDAEREALGIAVSGHYAYVGYAQSGLLVIDISNPATPRRLGICDTAGAYYGRFRTVIPK